MNCNRRLPPPAELIALKREKETCLCWQPVPGADGYDVYARPNEAADGNYSGLQYRKVNGAPVEGCEFCDENRNVTYRVAAVDENGASSELSDMVFPIKHEGLELLSIRYYSGERLLTQLPDADVRVAVTAINATAREEAVSLEAEWDGQRRTFALSIPNDGKLHEYRASLGAVSGGPITAAVYDRDGRRISCLSKFRPEGKALYDTLFERGLLVCDPQTPTLYDSPEDQKIADGTVLDGAEIGDCHIQFALEGTGADETAFEMQLGGITLRVSADGEAAALRKGEVLASGRLLGEAAGVIVHAYAGEETFRIFRNSENMPVLTAKTTDARGALRFACGGWQAAGLRIVSKKASFAGILPMGCEHPDPIWNIACWWSRFNWIRGGKADPITAQPDGSLTVENPGRSFTRSADGSEVTLRANASKEYSHTRRADEGWSHLLLEVLWDRPELGRLRLASVESLWLTMDMRMLQCENRTDGYDTGLHASQFVVYFNISGAGNDAMWLGLCNMDNRYLLDENRREMAFQMDPGTNTFIIAPPQEQFINGHMADGQWHSMSLDLMPVIRQAYEYGRTHGAFVESTMEDLKLNSMNLGFELPGSFDSAVRLSNMQLVAKLRETTE